MHVAGQQSAVPRRRRRPGGQWPRNATSREMLKNDEKNRGKPDNILVKIVEGGLTSGSARSRCWASRS